MLDRRALALCLVTDPQLVSADALVDTVLAAVRGGVTMVQLRDKSASDEVLLAQAVALVGVLRPLGIPLLVNDRVEVALRAGADGVHVGQDDESPEIARERLGPDAIIGLSITDAAQLARAERAPVDYYGVGPYFATATKPDHQPPLGLDGARALVSRASRPSIAIGGIHPPRAAAVRATGVAGLAVVSAICGELDPERAAHDLLTAVTAVVSSHPEVLP